MELLFKSSPAIKTPAVGLATCVVTIARPCGLTGILAAFKSSFIWENMPILSRTSKTIVITMYLFVMYIVVETAILRQSLNLLSFNLSE